MTAQTLPDEPNFCFVPAYDVEADVQQIRIVIEGLSGHVPTAAEFPVSETAWACQHSLPVLFPSTRSSRLYRKQRGVA